MSGDTLNQESSELLVDVPRAAIAVVIAALAAYSGYASARIETPSDLLVAFVLGVVLAYATLTFVRLAAVRLRTRRSG